jgi:zinc resistance-associated protein
MQLTPDQETRWPPVEQAIRDMAQARQDRMAAWRVEGKGADAIARLRRRADAMTAKASDIRKLADAAEPLYQSLSEDQKSRLRFLVKMAMGHHGGWRHHGGGWNG